MLFLGCGNNYVQCCHGGLECRYNPKDFLNAPEARLFHAITELMVPENFNVYNLDLSASAKWSSVLKIYP